MDNEPEADSPFEGFWRDLLEDTAATATEYEAQGWDVCSLNPGDVTPRYDSEKPFGLGVLVPNPQFDTVDELVNSGTFDNVEVYKSAVGPVVFLLVVERDEEREIAILIPAYYNRMTDSEFVEAVEDKEEMRFQIRALGEAHEISFAHEDCSLFLPEDDEERS